MHVLRVSSTFCDNFIFPKIMCSYIHKLMKPDEDFTAVTEYEILFPVTLKVMMVVTNVQSNI